MQGCVKLRALAPHKEGNEHFLLEATSVSWSSLCAATGLCVQSLSCSDGFLWVAKCLPDLKDQVMRQEQEQ